MPIKYTMAASNETQGLSVGGRSVVGEQLLQKEEGGHSHLISCVSMGLAGTHHVCVS